MVNILKYFTFELWEKASSAYEEDRNQAEKLWIENYLQYQEEYEKVKKKLSIEFVKYFEGNHEFHDWYVKKLITRQVRNNVNFIIYLREKKFIAQIKFSNVIKIAIPNNFDFSEGLGTVGYVEILAVNENILSIEFLLSTGASIMIYVTESPEIITNFDPV